MRPSSVLSAKIKTNAIWARIIRNCLLSLASRYIPNRFSSRLPYLRPYFSSSNYTLLKRWKNLKSPLKRDRFSSLALHRCDTLFISLVLFLSRFISRVFDCVLEVSPEISSLSARSLFFSFSASSSHLPSL